MHKNIYYLCDNSRLQVFAINHYVTTLSCCTHDDVQLSAISNECHLGIHYENNCMI